MKVFKAITAALILSLALPAMAKKTTVEENKKIVTDFYNMVFRDHKVQEAADKYFGSKYIQHNPLVPDGVKPFTGYFIPHFKANPEARSEIKRVIAEGDLVVLHVLSKQNKDDRGRAIVDIFRVEDGKIVEHWDVIQAIPEKAANTNTMF